MRTRVVGISPAKMAHAARVTMAAIAWISPRKNVRGMRRATAIVAVRPGMAPMTRP